MLLASLLTQPAAHHAPASAKAQALLCFIPRSSQSQRASSIALPLAVAGASWRLIPYARSPDRVDCAERRPLERSSLQQLQLPSLQRAWRKSEPPTGVGRGAASRASEQETP